MSVVVVGLEHGTTPLELLERVTVGDAELPKFLGVLRDRANLEESVLLSTCLRTEVYAVVDRFHEAVAEVQELLAQRAGVPVADLAETLSIRFDDDVPAHIFSVAAGLESAVVGETEVLGQVRRAAERAAEERSSGPVLGALFGHAVKTGRRVRTETAIARGTTSFSHTAVELASERVPGGLGGRRVTIVGAGEMGRGLLGALRAMTGAQAPARLSVLNRTEGRARSLIEGSPPPPPGGCGVVDFLALAAAGPVLAHSDVVLCAVRSAGPVLGPAELCPDGDRPDRPVVVVDLGMPRNVDPTAGSRAGVTLLDMDDLRSSVGRAVAGRAGEVEPRRRHRGRGGGPVPRQPARPRGRPGGVGAADPSRVGPGGRGDAPAWAVRRAVRRGVGAGRRSDSGRPGQGAARAHGAAEGDRRHAPGRPPGGGVAHPLRSLRAVPDPPSSPPPGVLRLATRGSELARRQSSLVAESLRRAWPGRAVELVVVSTRGDRLADVPLDQIGGQGIFVKEVQAAVLAGRADVAVHSAKDLPPRPAPGLVVAAVPRREDPRDALVGATLAGLAPGAVVATGSARRRAQLANLRPDLTFVALRGNMARRLDRAGDGTVEAVVVAVAALHRLGWRERLSDVLDPVLMLPQVGQGALALECRADDRDTARALTALDHAPSHRALRAEQALLAALGGSCSVPVAGWAEPAAAAGGSESNDGATRGGGRLRLHGMVASGDGRVLVRDRCEGDDPAVLGAELAEVLLGGAGGRSVVDWSLPASAGGVP